MSKKANFFAIGLFVVSAAIIAVLTLMVFGSLSIHKDTTSLLVTFKQSANGLRQGAKVKAYGVEVGTVRQVMLHKDQVSGEIVIPVLIEIDMEHVNDLLGHNDYTEFDDRAYHEILRSGAHAKLQAESIVTGLLYVEIQFGLEKGGFMLRDSRFNGQYSIPTVPTDMQVMINSLQQVVQNLGGTDIRGLVEETKGTMVDLRQNLNELNLASIEGNLNGLLTDTRGMLNSPELQKASNELVQIISTFNQIGTTLNQRTTGTLDRFDSSMEQLGSTLAQLESATGNAKLWLDPSNALYEEVIQALDQIGDASRALRILVEYVERNPNALITGRNKEESQQ